MLTHGVRTPGADHPAVMGDGVVEYLLSGRERGVRVGSGASVADSCVLIASQHW